MISPFFIDAVGEVLQWVPIATAQAFYSIAILSGMVLADILIRLYTWHADVVVAGFAVTSKVADGGNKS